MKLLALLLVAVTAVSTEAQLRYPFGPWTDPDDAKVAAKFHDRLEQAGGIPRAIRRVCAHSMSSSVEDEVASNFLVERATETYPALLDAMINEEKAPNSDASAYCRGNLEGTARLGVCYGHIGDGGGSEVDAHPVAVARRAGAHQALAKAIAGGGPRADTAMDVLLEAGNWANGRCPGLEHAVRIATPVLVKWLGVPKPPSRIPGGVHSAEAKWDRALRALSFGGADRAIAEKPVGAYLADDATAPLAALTPLLGCQGPTGPVVKALVDLGPAARAGILGVLRDDARPIHERLAAAEALMQTGQATLEAGDQKLVALLRAKARGPATELERCRAEAGLSAAPTAAVPPPPELMTCLSRYLCGPAKEIYQQTIERCCRSIAQYRTPDICVGVRDTSPVAAPHKTRSPP